MSGCAKLSRLLWFRSSRDPVDRSVAFAQRSEPVARGCERCKSVDAHNDDGRIRTHGLFVQGTSCRVGQKVAHKYPVGGASAAEPLGFMCSGGTDDVACMKGRQRVTWGYTYDRSLLPERRLASMSNAIGRSDASLASGGSRHRCGDSYYADNLRESGMPCSLGRLAANKVFKIHLTPGSGIRLGVKKHDFFFQDVGRARVRFRDESRRRVRGRFVIPAITTAGH